MTIGEIPQVLVKRLEFDTKSSRIKGLDAVLNNYPDGRVFLLTIAKEFGSWRLRPGVDIRFYVSTSAMV